MSYQVQKFPSETTDFSDVSNLNPQNGQVLSYDTDWGGKNFEGDKIAYSFRATGSWLTSGGSAYSYEPDVDLGDRPPKDIMQVAYNPGTATIHIANGLTQYNWALYESWYSSSYPRFSGVFVPPGTWLCRSTFGGRPVSSSGNATVQWFKGGQVNNKPSNASMTAVGPKFRIAQNEGRFTQIPTAIITTTASTTLLSVQTLETTTYQYGYAYLYVPYMSYHITQLG